MSDKETRDITLRNVKVKSYQKLKLLRLTLSVIENRKVSMGEAFDIAVDNTFKLNKEKIANLLKEI